MKQKCFKSFIVSKKESNLERIGTNFNVKFVTYNGPSESL